ncbi:solute carrier family 22 member 14 isoform X2 [Oryctolagus cuniculus]|uniref:solute carrier family 22 member 14 isoform X2 n=1 Tax=Oryctolagus cuniculus TaxID=9986 RepID=UPI003879003D
MAGGEAPPRTSRAGSPPAAPAHPHARPLEMLLRRLGTTDAKQEDKLAGVLSAAGTFGTFQRRLVALTFIPNMLSAFFLFLDQYTLTAQKPYCNTSWILAVGPDLSEAEQMNLTLPRAPDGSFLTCLMYLPVPWDLASIIQFGLNQTGSCQNGWIYPHSKKRSLINEFDLVCGKEPNRDTVNTLVLAGLLIGALIFGFLSDRLGRYPIILLSLLGFIVFGFGTAFVSSFYLYLFFRFGVSQAVVGYAISSVALATEWLVGEHRAHAVVLEHCFFAVGFMFLTGLAHSTRHWRLLFLMGGVPMFPLISSFWVLPESPRWLMVKGKVKQAKQVLCYAAAVNHKAVPFSLLEQQLLGKKAAKVSVLDFYSNRHLCKMTLVISCVWFTIAYSYFTLSLKLRDFGASLYLRQVVPAVMELPARLSCIFLLEQLGRKWSLALSLLQASILSLLLIVLPQELKSLMVLVIMLGEFSLAATVTVFFIYTAELLPTVLRATGLGLVSLASTAGAILSLTITSRVPPILPAFLCSLACALALCFTSLLPETQGQPLCDSLEHFLQTSAPKDVAQDAGSRARQKSQDTLPSEDTASEDVSEEAAKNALFNAQMLKLDPSLLTSSDSEVSQGRPAL